MILATLFICLQTVAPTGEHCTVHNAIRIFKYEAASMFQCFAVSVQRAAQEARKIEEIGDKDEMTFRVECVASRDT